MLTDSSDLNSICVYLKLGKIIPVIYIDQYQIGEPIYNVNWYRKACSVGAIPCGRASVSAHACSVG